MDTVFATKHALRVGIQEVTGKIEGTRFIPADPDVCILHWGDWHRSRVEAIARAEQMRYVDVTVYEDHVLFLKNLKF